MAAPRRAIGSGEPTTLPALEHTQDNRPRGSRPCAHVRPQYVVVVDANRRYADVSDSFCKLLGYPREELIGKKYDQFTVPGTTDIPVVFRPFCKRRVHAWNLGVGKSQRHAPSGSIRGVASF